MSNQRVILTVVHGRCLSHIRLSTGHSRQDSLAARTRLLHVSLCLVVVELDGRLAHCIIQSEVGASLTLRLSFERELGKVD